MDRRGFLSLVSAGVAGCASPDAPVIAHRDPSEPMRKIGVASCTDESRPQPLWDTVLADRPDLFIFGGDNVYASERPFDLCQLTAAYETQSKVANFARLRDTVQHMATWDDNDYGSNDGGAEFEHKQASKDAFLAMGRSRSTGPRGRCSSSSRACMATPAASNPSLLTN